MDNKTAIVIGATGLTGQFLVEGLSTSGEFSRVIVFTRRPLDFKHPKIKNEVIDFDNTESWKNKVVGDSLFCTIGTTIRTAGSREAFEKVDYHYPLRFAQAAKENGVRHFYLMSSVGADHESGNFYLRTKGRLEKVLEELHFDSLVIFRPSMLLGPRKEFRLGESIAKFLMKLFNWTLAGNASRYKAIESSDVAKAMVKAAELKRRSQICHYQEMMQLIRN